MSECSICAHPKLPAIDADIVKELPLKKIAWKYHVPATALQVHREHGPYTMREWQALDRTGQRDEPQIEGFTDQTDACQCYWCSMSGYQRLLRAWEDANRQEKERFCVDTREMDVPF